MSIVEIRGKMCPYFLDLNLLCFSSFLAAHGRHYPLDPKVVGPVITNELEQKEWELTLMQGHLCIIEKLHS